MIIVTLQPLPGFSPLENPKTRKFGVGKVDKDNLHEVLDKQIGIFKHLNGVSADSRLMYAFKDENDEVVGITFKHIIATLQEMDPCAGGNLVIFIEASQDNEKPSRVVGIETEGGERSTVRGSCSRMWNKHMSDKVREVAGIYCQQRYDGRFKLPSEGEYWEPGLEYAVHKVLIDGTRLRVLVTKKAIRSKMLHYMSNVNARIKRAERSGRGQVTDDKDVVSTNWLRGRKSSGMAWEEVYGHHFGNRSYPMAWKKVINMNEDEVRLKV